MSERQFLTLRADVRFLTVLILFCTGTALDGAMAWAFLAMGWATWFFVWRPAVRRAEAAQ